MSFKSLPQQADAELKEQAQVLVHMCFELEELGHSLLSRKWKWFSLSPPWSPCGWYLMHLPHGYWKEMVQVFQGMRQLLPSFL